MSDFTHAVRYKDSEGNWHALAAIKGEGVPAGGTTGQVLKKSSGTDYDTEWADESGGGGGTTNFNQLTNRPSYAGTTMTGSTAIPEVKTASWDAKQDAITSSSKLSASLVSGLATVATSGSYDDLSDKPEAVITEISAGTGIVTSTSSGQALIGLSSESIASLAKADTALQSHQSLSAYRTSSDQDTIDSGKQATLVSGTNIKTINNESLLGSGNIDVSGGTATEELLCFSYSTTEQTTSVTYPVILAAWEAGKLIVCDVGYTANTIKCVLIGRKGLYSTTNVALAGISYESDGTAKIITLVGNNQNFQFTYTSVPLTQSAWRVSEWKTSFSTVEYPSFSLLRGTANILARNLAPAYSSSSTYAVGDYCTYERYLYVCNTAITTAEAWTAAHWTQTTVYNMIHSAE